MDAIAKPAQQVIIEAIIQGSKPTKGVFVRHDPYNTKWRKRKRGNGQRGAQKAIARHIASTVIGAERKIEAALKQHGRKWRHFEQAIAYHKLMGIKGPRLGAIAFKACTGHDYAEVSTGAA
jgi:hypothetical protein